MIRITTPTDLRAIARGLCLAVAVSVAGPASAATPSVAGQTYDVCGPWKNQMRDYKRYAVSNYNALVPPNLAVSSYVPHSVWQFLSNGTVFGHPVDNAFTAVFDVVSQKGRSVPQVLSGEWIQKKAKLELILREGPGPDVFIDPTGVLTAQDTMISTAPHGLYSQQGPFRFVPGTEPDNDPGTLPGGLRSDTDYYVRILSPTSFQVLTAPRGAVVDLTSQPTTRTTMTPFGEALPDSFSILSELYLLGGRELVGIVDFVSVDDVELKAKLGKKGTELKIKLAGKSIYDIDTDDVVGFDFPGRLGYRGRTGDCLPDLAPVATTSVIEPYCRISGPDLQVQVVNQGSLAAGATTTRVDFGAYGFVDLPTPSLAANPIGTTSSATSLTTLSTPFPVGCFDPDCEFTITVDSAGDLDQLDVADDTADGLCQ